MTPAIRSAAAVAALGLMLVMAACGQEGEQAPERQALETYVGEVEGSRALVAVITDGDRMSGFVTDGKRYAKWFATAEIDDDGKATLVARDGFQLGEVTISDETASGEVTVGLGEEAFEAELATGDAGLFTAAEAKGQDSFEAGWVVLPDGRTLGTYDTNIDEKFTTRPAPELKPTVDIRGFGAQAPAQHSSLFLDANVQAP